MNRIMPYQEIFVLIPSHSLEDFPTELPEEQAAGLLNAFAIAWHPVLLADARALPRWNRSDSPPEPAPGKLFVVPPLCNDWLSGGWADFARSKGAVVVADATDRPAMIEQALAPLTLESPPDADLVADFFALGTSLLQIELLTRHMRHYSNLDEVHLQREAVAAADAALAHDAEAAHVHLKACFELLTEARERFYPIECYLLDLCLLIPRLADEHLERVLDGPTSANILMTAADLEEIATQKPALVARLRDRWNEGRVECIGGEYHENPAPLVPLSSLQWEFRHGRETFQRLLSRVPTTWGRRRYGLSTLLPQLLHKWGYLSALHVLLDDGIYPDVEHSKIRWEGCDGTIIDALTRIPLAGDSATSFLRFSQRMAESMEQDQAAALILARWPEVRAPWLDDLRRMNRYSPCLGRFVTFGHFFSQTEDPGRLSAFDASEYLSPFLVQSVARQEANAVSRFVDFTHRRCRFDAAAWCTALARLIAGQAPVADDTAAQEKLLEQAGPDADAETIARAEAMLAEFVPGSAARLGEIILSGAGKQPGMLVINSCSFARRVSVDLAGFIHPPAVGGPVKHVQFDNLRKTAIVDLPGCGFAWIAASTATTQAPQVHDTPCAAGNIIRNELFEVHINEATGSIARVKGYGRSPNRLSQQIGFRFPRERSFTVEEDGQQFEERSYYSEMRCRSIEITSTRPALGEIVTTGDIFDQTNGAVLATFRQATRVWRSRPVVEIEIELDVKQMPDGNPWTNYYALRFAYHDSEAALTRGIFGGAQKFTGERFETLDYIEIADEQQRTTICPLGLPFHRKTGPRTFDTLLITAGETKRRFKCVIALDADYPMQAALDTTVPVLSVPTSSGPPRTGHSGWFFHLSARNVQILQVLPATTPDPDEPEVWEAHDRGAAQEGIGIVLRLVETEGRHRKVKLQCFRYPKSARLCDFEGRTIAQLRVEADSVLLDVTAYEIADIELRFT